MKKYKQQDSASGGEGACWLSLNPTSWLDLWFTLSEAWAWSRTWGRQNELVPRLSIPISLSSLGVMGWSDEDHSYPKDAPGEISSAWFPLTHLSKLFQRTPCHKRARYHNASKKSVLQCPDTDVAVNTAWCLIQVLFPTPSYTIIRTMACTKSPLSSHFGMLGAFSNKDFIWLSTKPHCKPIYNMEIAMRLDSGFCLFNTIISYF